MVYYLISRKLLEGNLLMLFLHKVGWKAKLNEMENVATRKSDSKKAVEPHYTGRRDKRGKRRKE